MVTIQFAENGARLFTLVASCRSIEVKMTLLKVSIGLHGSMVVVVVVFVVVCFLFVCLFVC